jgi:desulfoferrodoxin (superoxide reductase-like protein)
MAQRFARREALRLLGLSIGAAGVARVIGACTDEPAAPARGPTVFQPPPPTDGDEFVPGTSPPVNAGDVPPTVPNPVWEARVKQLEDEQLRVAGFVYSLTQPGKWSGKERSHVPVASAAVESSRARVTVVVQHVMGKNGLDAGAYDGGDAADGGDGASDAATDALDGALDAADAGPDADASTPDAAPPPEHYITTIYLRADLNGSSVVVGLWEFSSTDAAPPTVKFTMPDGVSSVVAHEYCTLHGLWKAAPLTF